jgi:2-C-methyl-D-erythritol 4-phosphate cytidylyltransferase/2-C-methyl-D-erythritol 2,4-cyclodiphosphate synthase
LVRVQTPQAFPFEKILAAYQALPAETELADDIAVARQAGLHVVTVAGDARLDKITWAEDFARMDALLSPPYLPRTATGYDAHRFGAGDHVTLCGVAVPFSQGLAGHSDADVGWHALADAIYGGLAAGDIGYHFPPSDSRWKGAPSATFLSHAAQLVAQAGGRINHADVTLICEAPRIGPHRPQMVAETAKVLGLRPDQVSIKATTTEGMGFTGRGEGIAAQASATLLLPPTYRGQREDRCP